MLKAIIVDDEQDGREALQKLIGTYCRNVKVEAMADSVQNALPMIEKHKPDILFLDIEMPYGSGFDLLKQINDQNIKIIFITAHSHYAIKAIKFAAVDYLLKPVDIDDLIAAVARAESRIVPVTGATQSLQDTKNASQKIALPLHDGLVYLSVTDIIRFEADGSYTTAYITDGKSYMVSKNIKEYETMLSGNGFFRCHISHLVNLTHVKRFSRHDGYYADMSDGVRVEIARRKKDDFISKMRSFL